MSGRDHHPPCPCGRELADECMNRYPECRPDPLGGFTIEEPIGSSSPWVEVGVTADGGRVMVAPVGTPLYDGPVYVGVEGDEPERVDEELSDDPYR